MKQKYFSRDRIKNYFPLPNEIFCLNLSHGEISIYAYLLYLENRKTYQCHPSYRSIGQAVGMSKNTVRKYVDSLEHKGIIKTQYTNVRRHDGRVQNGNLLYTILPIQNVVDSFHEHQMGTASIGTTQANCARV